ncbi:sugar phosphate nucleotidyltransferase [Paenibacillus sp. 481]|uniref:sugar phosphate nucleotidyltransferase n=1 Tax=Paenibacillus sp. 481 TaxID=2835869 RepID=UPI001E64F66E|nr:sugar phosphate nucleotidyltransferase [Paenibacillus sp. 481]UHA72271.1 NTP transferase domain-containing protein [Paenibacillus sp. 481]
MKAVIMAGGKGTRLRPLTLQTPKPMVPLLNRPCMEYIIELLKRYDIHQIAVTVQYLPDVIRHHFGDGSQFGVELHYFEELLPLGTAGSIKNAAAFLDEPFIVISGDGLTDFNLRRAVQFHRERNALATMVLTQVASPLEYGVVMTAEDGLVTRFLEKPSWSEVFSDTVNTGIYVLEPEILDWIPENGTYDFSLNLFPALLREQKPLYGYVAEGYWSDIGNLQQYRQTQFDMLDRKVGVRISASEPLPGLFVEQGVRLPSRIRLSGPAYIGAGCTLHSSCAIGPYTILGQGNTVYPNSSIERSIVWDGNTIGDYTELQGALLMNRSIIGSGAYVQEGAVIGSGCTIGAKASVRSQVKLWPNKTVHANDVVNASLIWADESLRPLFKGRGIVGIPNAHITPEFVGKLASAYGSILTTNATIALACNSHPFAQLLQTSFAAGLRSIGVHVIDIGPCSEEVCRYAVRHLNADGAVHIQLRTSTDNAQVVLSWMDAQGLPIAKSLERKIENAFYQEDYARSHADRIGRWRRYEEATSDYVEELRQMIAFDNIREANFTLVLQYSPLDEHDTIEQWSNAIGGTRMLIQAHNGAVHTVAEHVQNYRAHIGVHMENDGSLQLITAEGVVVTSSMLQSLLIVALARAGTDAVLGIPISAPITAEQLAADTGLRVVRTREPLRAMMEAAVGLPFSPFSQRLYAISLILQLMSQEDLSLTELIQQLPELHIVKEEVPCAWHEKGTMMRQMMDWVRRSELEAELLDGIRVQTEDGWVLILPDQDEPAFTVVAQSESASKARILATDFAARLHTTYQTLRK